MVKLSNEKHTIINDEEPDASLLINYIRGISTAEEKMHISMWLEKNTANEEILFQITQIYYAQRTKQRIQARNSAIAFSKVQQQLHKKLRRVFIFRFLAVAGCIALFASVAFNFYFLKPKESWEQQITMQTNAGMRTNFTLPDGTEVFLNSATQLIYPVPFDANERKVELDGEGYFKVTHDPERPFIVSVPDKAFELEVLGTEFNLQAYSSDTLLRTTLIKGAVRLGIETAPGVKRYVNLQPSQIAIYHSGQKSFHITPVNPVYETAWIEGKIMFKDTPLPDVLNRLSHFYNVHFHIEDTLINRYTFTGTFENRQLSQVLDYLRISSQIKYKIQTPQEDDSKERKQTYVILTK